MKIASNPKHGISLLNLSMCKVSNSHTSYTSDDNIALSLLPSNHNLKEYLAIVWSISNLQHRETNLQYLLATKHSSGPYGKIILINNDNISICIVPFASGYKALLPIITHYYYYHQENRHKHFTSPKGATGQVAQVHTLSAHRL